MREQFCSVAGELYIQKYGKRSEKNIRIMRGILEKVTIMFFCCVAETEKKTELKTATSKLCKKKKKKVTIMRLK